jgi:hypothetical protein
VAFGVHFGFAPGNIPAYPFASIPDGWKWYPYWMPWSPTMHRRWRWVRRALLTPDGGLAQSCAARYQLPFTTAYALAKTWGLGVRGGGVAFVYPSGDGSPPRAVVFFGLDDVPYAPPLEEDGP